MHLLNIAKEVLCLSEFKMSMLAQSVTCPGFSTLIYLLTTSTSETIINRLSDSKAFRNAKWAREYLEGFKMEIYGVNIAVKLIYRRLCLKHTKAMNFQQRH